MSLIANWVSRGGLDSKIFAEVGRRQISDRHGKVRMVKNVKRLGAELGMKRLRQNEGFHCRGIDIGKAGSARNVASRVPKLTGLRGRIKR